MPIQVRLQQPSQEYDPVNEYYFRRELEQIVQQALQLAASIAEGNNVPTSMTHKRHTYTPGVAFGISAEIT